MSLSIYLLLLLSQLIYISTIKTTYGGSLPNVPSKVICGDDEMEVDIDGSISKFSGAHVLGLKEYPDGSCQAEKIGRTELRFRFSFSEYYRCGTTQIRNKLTGTRTFYNRIVIEFDDGREEQVLVKCQQGNQYAAVLDTNHLNNINNNESKSTRERRDVLPAGFKEDPNLIPVTEQIGRAPEPMLTMSVKKEGLRIGPKLVVEPGAPLTMEVSLDPVSKDIYGILLSQLDVTDTGTQSEVLFHNGCSVDSYLFENFVTLDGDVLTAKFKAFKFPDTNYVLFRGTINVCLNSCKGIQCSTGQLGYGKRRRRDVNSSNDFLPMNYDYEIHTAAILQVANTKNLTTNYSNNNSSTNQHQLAILGSTYQPRITTNAKQTQTEQFAIPRLTDESIKRYEYDEGNRGITLTIGKWIFCTMFIGLIFFQ